MLVERRGILALQKGHLAAFFWFGPLLSEPDRKRQDAASTWAAKAPHIAWLT
jgi:hypothetical protein